MIEKIKANIDKITLVLSIVAGALLVPSIIERIGSNMSEYYIILLIEYGLLLVSNLMFVIKVSKILSFHYKNVIIRIPN